MTTGEGRHEPKKILTTSRAISKISPTQWATCEFKSEKTLGGSCVVE
jgi:hypothetical protein